MSGNQNFADQENDEAGAFNADSLEMWQEGIPLSRISWKQYAAKDRLLYKTGAASGQTLSGYILTISLCQIMKQS